MLSAPNYLYRSIPNHPQSNLAQGQANFPTPDKHESEVKDDLFFFYIFIFHFSLFIDISSHPSTVSFQVFTIFFSDCFYCAVFFIAYAMANKLELDLTGRMKGRKKLRFELPSLIKPDAHQD